MSVVVGNSNRTFVESSKVYDKAEYYDVSFKGVRTVEIYIVLCLNTYRTGIGKPKDEL